MNSEYFIKFSKLFERFKLNRQINPNAVESFYGHMAGDDKGESFTRGLTDGISKAIVYNIGDGLKKLLCMTKTPKINEGTIHLPFHTTFLDVAFTKEELEKYGVNIRSDEIVGIMVTDKIQFLSQNEDGITHEVAHGMGLRITFLGIERHKDDKIEFLFEVFNKQVNIEDYDFKSYTLHKNPTTDPVAREFVYRFLLNFLNFRNLPDVIEVEHKRTIENMQRRIREGKTPIPSSIEVHVTGQTKAYIDRIERLTETKWHYNYQFDVAGHLRFLKSPRYKVKGLIWIEPYRKGQGVYVPHNYVADSKILPESVTDDYVSVEDDENE